MSALLVLADAAVPAAVESLARTRLGRDLTWQRADPAELPQRLAAMAQRPAAALVLAPLGERLPAAPVVAGVPVGVVVFEAAAQLQRWLDAMSRFVGGDRPVLVTAMQKPSYVAWAERLQRGFAPAQPEALRLPATTSRDELVQLLAGGFGLCLYAGHGRSRGWSGYRGLRWPHLAAVPQRGVGGSVISLSCSALQQDRAGSRPFALEWLWSGRLCSFFGADGELRLKSLVRIAEFVLAARAARPATLGALVHAVDGCVQAEADAALALDWARFRLLGNPLQELALRP